MKQFNGTDYDVLYPKTLVSQIDGNWPLNKVSGVLSIDNGGTGGGALPITSGGTGATTVNGILQNLGIADSLQVEIMTYVGTGAYGQSNPNVLNFKKKPKYFYLFAQSYVDPNRGLYMFPTVNTASTSGVAGEPYILYEVYSDLVSAENTYNTRYYLGVRPGNYSDRIYSGGGGWFGNSYRWYSVKQNTDVAGTIENSSEYQFNKQGYTYYILVYY